MQGLYKEKKGYTYRHVVPLGTEVPDQFPLGPTAGQLWFATDTLSMYVFIGIGQVGANAGGWFNLKQALYA